MAITLRALPKTLIQAKAGVEKDRYIEQFAALALSAAPHPPYSSDVEIDPATLRPAPGFTEILSADSELFAKIPLVAAGDNPETKLEDFPPEARWVYEGYPLVDGESFSSVKVLCLEKEWEGLARRTVFIERETNLSRIYFAVPGLRLDPATPGLAPALLSQLDGAPGVNRATMLMDSTSPLALVASGGPSFSEIGPPVISCFLEVVSSLAWVQPEIAPFVAGGAALINFIMGMAFPNPSMLADIKKIADGIYDRMEFFQLETDVKNKLAHLRSLSDWIHNVQTALNTQSTATFVFTLTQQNGILAELNRQIGPEGLILLRNQLYGDSALKDGPAYGSPHEWSIASAKLHLLFFTAAQYLFLLKFKIVLLAQAFEDGWVPAGVIMDSRRSNPDNTFPVLLEEIKSFKSALPPIIAAVRKRRQASVQLGDNDCTVAYSRQQMPVGRSRREEWVGGDGKAYRQRRDSLYMGYYTDQLVRAIEDNPSKDNFETDGDGKTHCSPMGQCFTSSGAIAWHSWRRMEIQDLALYDGKNPQDWLLYDGHSDGRPFWYSGHERIEAALPPYITRMLQDFDSWAKTPSGLDDSVKALEDKWQPKLPPELKFGLVFGPEWGGKAKPDEVWSDKAVSVRYSFAVRSNILRESEKSNDKTSTLWTAPAGRCLPRIVGLPTEGDYLTYVRDVCLYRQFRKQMPDGKFKMSTNRLVKIISRAPGQKGFIGERVDDASTEHDRVELSQA